MGFYEEYQQKKKTLEEAYALLKDGDFIWTCEASAEPLTFKRHLHEMHGKVHDLILYAGLSAERAPICDDEYADLISFESLFFPRYLTPLQKTGRASYMPMHLRNAGLDTIYRYKYTGRHINFLVLTVSPMDKHGYFTSGSTAINIRDLVEYADHIIVEVNESNPRTFGDTYIHISEVDTIIDSEDNKIIYIPVRDPNETDAVIGKTIAELVNEGDTVQLGIGGIPTACARELTHKKHLGIHTEMLNDGLVYLLKSGAIDNTAKNYYQNKIITTFSMGSKDVYDYIDDNPNILHLRSAYVNQPAIISRNDNFVSINTTLQIDLMGQCASEAIGTSQISGVGGQTDTAVGAKESNGGRAVIALHSTRELKQKDGTKKRVSNIYPVHPKGTVISLMRNDVDFVITEYGVAALRGASLKERATSLINIAHPDFRDELTEAAKKWYLI
ncbi:MAG: 4-hydroxybutyrate--acetyl-CoA CoA transferase [Clostridia bacterium]|nr:4-hydroxybutyrate--acetyl-CoA CoA transferase [Clostridia bacterium]